MVLASPSKTIWLLRPQLAPRASGALQMATRDPPLASALQSLPLAKNPSERPSGDQKGKYAPSVPGSSIASSLPSGFNHNVLLPSRLATNTIRVPSGESAGGPSRYMGAKCVPSGGSKVDLIKRRTGCARHQAAPQAATMMSAIASMAAAPAARNLHPPCLLLGPTAGTEACVSAFAIHASCSFTSCAV